MDKPIKDVCREWQVHPVTKYLLDQIDKNVNLVGESFTEGAFVSDNQFETLKLHLEAVGMAKALLDTQDFILSLHEDDYDNS